MAFIFSRFWPLPKKKIPFCESVLSNNLSESGIRFDAIWNEIPSYYSRFFASQLVITS